eukprot:4875535-Karenia_brevis.AAC.1
MSGDRGRLRDELDGIHQYFSSQVGNLGKALDEDLDDYEKEMLGIEERCKDKMEDLQEEIGQTI